MNQLSPRFSVGDIIAPDHRPWEFHEVRAVNLDTYTLKYLGDGGDFETNEGIWRVDMNGILAFNYYFQEDLESILKE